MNLAHDLQVLQAMAEELADFLLSDVLLWQMRAPSDFPKLSLGALLLMHVRLTAAQAHLTAEQRPELERASRAIEAVLARWPVAAEKKAQQELRMRVNLWQRFLEDWREEPHAGADEYAHAVTPRVIAGLLLRRFPRLAHSAEALRLGPLDARARAQLPRGPFVWAPELEPGFPAEDFWYLYRGAG